jgi:hypothetical protein
MKRIVLVIAGLMAGAWSAASAFAGDAMSPLDPFDRLVGGRWRLGETIQEFEWDMDRHQLLARAYSISAEGERLVSAGAWYYHPGEDSVVGYFVARDMGIGLFEYTTRFEGDVMISQIVAWAGEGGKRAYEERWRFTGPDSYVWELYESGEQGQKKAMEGVFQRVE